jgi:hypothetical protein
MDQVVKAAANFETLEAEIVHSAAEAIAERAAASINTGLERFGVTYRVQGTDSRLSYAAVNLAADLTATRDYLAVIEAIVTQRRALAGSILASADPDPVDRRRAIVIVGECIGAESFVKSSRGTLNRLDNGAKADAVARCSAALRDATNEIVAEVLAAHDKRVEQALRDRVAALAGGAQ